MHVVVDLVDQTLECRDLRQQSEVVRRANIHQQHVVQVHRVLVAIGCHGLLRTLKDHLRHITGVLVGAHTVPARVVVVAHHRAGKVAGGELATRLTRVRASPTDRSTHDSHPAGSTQYPGRQQRIVLTLRKLAAWIAPLSLGGVVRVFRIDWVFRVVGVKVVKVVKVKTLAVAT
eukprot:COSAG01_NODE_25_length_37050_cov_211.559119_21_plen_174_part_00